jgi:hypothetical protein
MGPAIRVMVDFERGGWKQIAGRLGHGRRGESWRDRSRPVCHSWRALGGAERSGVDACWDSAGLVPFLPTRPVGALPGKCRDAVRQNATECDDSQRPEQLPRCVLTSASAPVGGPTGRLDKGEVECSNLSGPTALTSANTRVMFCAVNARQTRRPRSGHRTASHLCVGFLAGRWTGQADRAVGHGPLDWTGRRI